MTQIRPLLVFQDVAVCDGPYPHAQHEATLITDGYRAAVLSGSRTDDHDHKAVSRDKTRISAFCGHPTGSDREPCSGQLTWEVDTPGTWTYDHDAIEMLMNCGSKIES